jgi:hypothetical protein
LFALVVMPWNPALWWATLRLRLAVEMDCDRRLLRRGVDPRRYATLLLAVGEHKSTTPFAWATALGDSTSSLEKRVIAMLSPVHPRHPRLAVAALTAAAIAIALIACASPVPDSIMPPPTLARSTDQHQQVPAGSYEVAASRSCTNCAHRPVRGDTITLINRGTGNAIHAIYRGKSDDTLMVDYPASTAHRVYRGKDDLEVPTCTAAQLAQKVAKLGGFWPRCVE